MRTRRIGRTLMAGTALAGLAMLPACGHRETEADIVRAAIRKTRGAVTGINYSDTRGDGETSVKLAETDDFRYKAQIVFDGTRGFDEVAYDDTLAVRFVEPGRVGRFLRTDGSEPTELDGITTFDALKSRRWVLDPSEAPFTAVGSARTSQIGRDPVADAQQALDYVEAAVLEAAGLQRYSPDSISPAYPKSEDDLPKPQSGEIRYDLRRPKLPAAAAATTGAQGEVALPGTKHFRKMAVFVKDGYITHVVEHVGLGGKYLNETIRYMRNLLRDAKAPKEIRSQFEKVVSQGRPDALPARILEFVNLGLKFVGEDPVLIRNMSLEISRDDTSVHVDLPTQDVVKGDLSGLIFSRAAKAAELAAQQQATQGGQSGDTGATSTTEPGQPADQQPVGDTSTTAPSG
jgi:hypothetical protein